MNVIRCLGRALVALPVLALFAVLALVAGVSEWRKKQKLGGAYEGPLDGDYDAE